MPKHFNLRQILAREKYSFTHSDINLLVCFVSVCLSFSSQTDGLIFFFRISTHVGREQNAWLNQLWQIFQVSKPQSSPRPRYYHHCGWLLIDVIFMKCFVSFTQHFRCNKMQKFNFCLISPGNISSKDLTIMFCFVFLFVFWQIWDKLLCSFWPKTWQMCKNKSSGRRQILFSQHHGLHTPTLFYCLINK